MPAPHLAEFVSAYVLEAEEHLSTANTHLLATETAIRAGESNLRGVREVFRALHTVKGLSAMVGVEPVVVLSHRMEALLRTADRTHARLPLGAVDVLLRGVQAIEQRVSAFRDGRAVEPAPVGLLREIDAFDAEAPESLAGARLALDLPPELSSKLGAAELEQLQIGLAGGKQALCVTFEPSTEKAERGVTIKAVRDALERLGDIVKVVPVSLQGSASGAGLAFAIIMLTLHEQAQIALAIEGQLAVSSVAAPGTPAEPVLTSELEIAEPEHDFEAQQQGFVRVNVTRLDESVERLSALIVNRFRMNRAIAKLTSAGVDTRELLQIQNESGRQLRDLRGAIFRVRMVPTADLLERIPLLVRGLRRAVDRLVSVQIDAGTTEVDKAVAERLFPALVHLVRNAVDHAIESPDERLRRGKPQEGLLKISCAARSDTWLELLVEDDGRGIDGEAIARKARRDVPASEAALLELLCAPGLSTREVATTTSGRGMGMEIVKRIVEQLGGELSLRTQLGVGSTFVLRVPLSLSIVDGFSFECGQQRFVVPVSSVDEIIEVEDSALVRSPSSARGGLPVSMLERRGRVVPLLSLAGVLGLSGGGSDKKAMIVRRGAEAVAFAVERMLGQQEVVVRPLEDELVRVPGVAGATDLGDGKPTLVLDLAGLGAAVNRRQLELHS
ncbi:MAG TPA: chemotaxis protein CheW [Polyangiaceae bacterium]